ncbi:riboflavin synthase subunit alpha [Aliidiomarina soli]|uniref:Riboflavin synthase n=1 Tax=Aliidiomarina soli TaxID=1928574 RepID=A0A432WMM8_9GAMM|nr:riboflavin synthase subunit alpha [Aliidiomarina soli]RUO35070.1 riboflavin synthase [Aliidiomarina soli]
MFTGIVQTQARVDAIEDKNQFRHLRLAVNPLHLQNLEVGASIAINGCCLTVTRFEEQGEQGFAEFDVIDETLRLTNLGRLQQADTVNFERSLTVGRELGGHIVSGHVHCVATVTERNDSANNCSMRLEVPVKWMEYILAKGFVAVDGASLTVGETDENGFWLHLIPETLSVTTLGRVQVGDSLNIEADQQTITTVETVKRVLAKQMAG